MTQPGSVPRRSEDDLAYAGVLGQSRLLADGVVSAAELVETLLARIERLQPRLNAFRVVLADEARAAARAADEARARGDARPLLGVPVAVKDNIPVAGQATMAGTGSAQPVATNDDTVVRRLRAAGLIPIGLTHLPELALWAATESRHHGVTRNPWDLTRSPGGSSGGSAAAVAAGLVPVAHATDGLGSIRIPAASCGLVGLKPTHGLVPLGPDPDHWVGLSHSGVLTRSVADTAAVLDVLVDPSPRFLEAIATRPDRWRIAVTRKPLTPVRIDPEVRRVLDEAIERLGELGHEVRERDPAYGSALRNSNTVRYLAGTAQDVAALADPDATERRTRTLAAMGRALPAGSTTWARRKGREFAQRMRAFFEATDVLVSPTVARLPVRAGSIRGVGLARTSALMVPRAAFTAPWNACGFPALSLPLGWTGDGLPVGVQFVAPPGGDAMLLRLGAQLEALYGWTERHPPL